MSQLKNTRTLTMSAMLVALATILGFVKIPVTNIIELRFHSIPVALAGTLFGPLIGGIVGALSDIGAYLVKPTGAFFPGFTISAAITGIIFALVLYRKTVTIYRLILAQVINTVVISLLLNTYWLSILYGLPFIATFTSRIVTQLVMLPINCILFGLVIKPICEVPYIKQLRLVTK